MIPSTALAAEAVALMHQINRRLLARRLVALRLAAQRAQFTRRVLDGEACAELVPADTEYAHC